MAKPVVKRAPKKEKKNIPQGRFYINASFNNTLITVTDLEGNTVSLLLGHPLPNPPLHAKTFGRRFQCTPGHSMHMSGS